MNNNITDPNPQNVPPNSREMSCATCHWWFPITKDTAETKAFGKCKRNPPAMLVQEGQTYSGHPIVPGSEFCGEWLQSFTYAE